MNNEICDEKLVSMITKELAKIGLLIPISELESSVIQCYDRIRDAHSLAPENVTIDAYLKNDKYYGILTNVACADIISRTRLLQCTDGYEVAATLSLLQKYLDGLAEIANTERQQAPAVFEEILSKLPVNLVIERGPDGGWITKVPRGKGGKPAVEPMQPLSPPEPIRIIPPHEHAALHTGRFTVPNNSVVIPKSIYEAFIKKIQKNTEDIKEQRQERHICSSCDKALCGDCDGCQNCNETECGADLVISVNYQGECFGFRIDPGTVGLERAAYTEAEWEECIGALKHAILKAGKTLSKRSGEMMTVFQKAFIRERLREDD